MRKTAKMIALEQSHGQDIKTILKESYGKYGFNRSAVDLGITSQTLIRWWMLLNLKGHIQHILEDDKNA